MKTDSFIQESTCVHTQVYTNDVNLTVDFINFLVRSVRKFSRETSLGIVLWI